MYEIQLWYPSCFLSILIRGKLCQALTKSFTIPNNTNIHVRNVICIGSITLAFTYICMESKLLAQIFQYRHIVFHTFTPLRKVPAHIFIS